MPVQTTFVAGILLAVAVAACSGSNGGSPGTGGDGGTGGDPCEPTAIQALVAADTPVRLIGREHGHPARIGGAFRESAREPIPAARAFLARIGRGVGLDAVDADLEVGAVRRGLAGDYVRFQQLHRGLPVFDHEVVVQVASSGVGSEIRHARLGHARIARDLGTTPAIPAAAAAAAARAELPGPATPEVAEVRLGVHVGPDGGRLAYRALVATKKPAAAREVFVDAGNGAVLESRDLFRRAEGTGLVFDPNPVAWTGDTSLADDGDETSPALDAARRRVTLPRLDGSGYLRGDYVDARAPEGTERAHSPELVFDFDRSEDGFEQTMAYFHLDRVQTRLQSLGFTDVLARPQVVISNGAEDDNSWFDPMSKTITTGTGGIDDGEDADVIVHEYGHAMQHDQMTGFGIGGDAGALGEGFGDYLASSIADTLTRQRVDPACLAEWNSNAWRDEDDGDRLMCLRRVDRTRHYPEGLRGEVHVDGQVWSAVLWEARGVLGADVVDRLVIESHFTTSRLEKYPSAAEGILETDRLLFDGAHLSTLIPIFVDRGLLRTPTPPALFPDVLESRAIAVTNPRNGFSYADRLDDRQEVRVPGAAGLRLHFTGIDLEVHESCVNQACDNLYLTDDTGHLFQILSGHHGDTYSVVIPGEAVHLRLVTDGASGGFGYLVDRVDVMGYRSCGNGVRDGVEACEGADLGGATCQALGFVDGALSCGADCALDTTACVAAPGCGDGEIGPEEECDGSDLGGSTCRSLGFRSGTLVCSAACRKDTTGCMECGNGVREASEACDGADTAGLTCEGLGLGTGVPICSTACTLDTSVCVPDECS